MNVKQNTDLRGSERVCSKQMVGESEAGHILGRYRWYRRNNGTCWLRMVMFRVPITFSPTYEVLFGVESNMRMEGMEQ